MRSSCRQLLLLLAALLCCFGGRRVGEAKKMKITTTPETTPTRKICHRQGPLDGIFTRSFSVISMQRYCEMLGSFSLVLRSINANWRRMANSDGACFDEKSLKFEPEDHAFVLKAMFRHHVDVDGNGRMSRSELSRFLVPALQYHLLPGLLNSEYAHLLRTYFRPMDSVGESLFVDILLRMMQEEWQLLVKRTIPDLDGDGCVTRMEFARALCRKRINEIDFYFRVADLDNNRAVTSPEFDRFKSITPVEQGEEKGAKKFFGFFNALSSMIANYTADAYQQTSYAHDDMITFNEVNLYICEYVI